MEAQRVSFELQTKEWNQDLARRNTDWLAQIQALNVQLNTQLTLVNTLKVEHTTRMNDALAQFEAWKRAQDQKHVATVTRLEKELADLMNRKDAEIAKLKSEHENARRAWDQTTLKVNATCEGLRMDCLQKDSKIAELQHIIDSLRDVQAQLVEIRSHNENIFGQKAELQNELTGASEYITDLESKFYQSRLECLELLRQLKEREAQCESYN